MIVNNRTTDWQMSMGEVLEPLRRDSIPDRIATQLRSGIVTGRLPPGQALREVEIARQLGVSRRPVREAFQRLIQEGLLEAHPARGVFVPQRTADDIADLYLARGAVETTAAQLLTRSGTAEVALGSFYPERADLVTEHAEIVQAIQRQDADAATRLLERHMTNSGHRLVGRAEPRAVSSSSSDPC
jgi:DNA-binding GntR family transcriptional regulator